MKVAVLLAGELRTWLRTSPYIFKFFDAQSADIDYYFATWSTSSNKKIQDGQGYIDKITVDQDMISAPFLAHQKNLIASRIFEQDFKVFPNYYYQSWLAKQANLLKRQHELANNFVYDQVVEMRPDLILGMNERSTPWRVLTDGEFAPGNHNRVVSKGMVAKPDLYSRSNSWTNDILSNRIDLKYSTRKQLLNSHDPFGKNSYLSPDSEQLLSDWLMKRKIVCANEVDFSFCAVVRDNFPDDLSKLTFGLIDQYTQDWYKATVHLMYEL